MKNDILSVVVTYNRLELLKENIQGLLNQTNNNFDILIIDNKSTDGTDKYLEQIKSDRISYIITDKNIGGAGGFNLGLRYAIENNYSYAWVMDDDTIPEENSLEKLLNAKEILKDEFSFLNSYVKWIDGSICKMNAPMVDRKLLTLQNYELLDKKMIILSSCSFVSCFINLTKVGKCGLPIKEFFIYYDDIEYTSRIGRVLPGYLVVDSVVVHKMKNNESTTVENLTNVDKINRLVYDYRNGYKFCREEGFIKTIKYNIKYFYHVFRVLISKNGFKFKKIKSMTKGMCLGLFFNPKIEYVIEKKTNKNI